MGKDVYELTETLRQLDVALLNIRKDMISAVVRLLTGSEMTQEQIDTITHETLVLCPFGLRGKPYYNVLRAHPNIIGFHGSRDRKPAVFVVDESCSTIRFEMPDVEATA